ncbi:MAG TPA: helix-turn-helix domain-containing protein [Nocardioides sp.]
MAPTRAPQNTTEAEVNRPPDGGPPSLLVQVPVAARMLGIGRTKVYELVNDGELELVHIGCRSLVPVDSVQSFSDRLREQTAAALASDPFGDVVRFRESPWDDSQPPAA